MPASDVELCSAALNLLGDAAITSLTEDNDRARYCNRLFSLNRDAMTREHPWNCAQTRATLGKLADAPLSAWANQFALPTDPYCLRVLTLNADPGSGEDPGEDFIIEARNLLTDEPTATIVYLKRMTDAAEMDAMFYDALIHRLAWKLAYPITRKRTLRKDAKDEYDDLISSAWGADGQEGTPDPIVSDDLTKARDS